MVTIKPGPSMPDQINEVHVFQEKPLAIDRSDGLEVLLPMISLEENYGISFTKVCPSARAPPRPPRCVGKRLPPWTRRLAQTRLVLVVEAASALAQRLTGRWISTGAPASICLIEYGMQPRMLVRKSHTGVHTRAPVRCPCDPVLLAKFAWRGPPALTIETEYPPHLRRSRPSIGRRP